VSDLKGGELLFSFYDFLILIPLLKIDAISKRLKLEISAWWHMKDLFD